MASAESSPSVRIDDIYWIIGRDNITLSHIRLIDRGAAGEAHEVSSRPDLEDSR